MSSSNRLAYILVFLAITFVMYKAASGHANLVENWGVTMVGMQPRVDTYDCTGCKNGPSVFGNNQAQLQNSQNQLVNTEIMTPHQRNLLAESLNPGIKLSSTAQASAKNGPPIQSFNLQNNIEYYDGEKPNPGFPVYTVPGTYQSNTPPRFNSVGLNSFVKYNLPQEKNLASYANDPLTNAHQPAQENYQPLDLANLVEKPQIKEDYQQSCQSVTGKETAQMFNTLTEQGNEVASKLPVQSMNTMSYNEKPEIVNCDRYVVGLLKSRQYGQADFIRGDLAIVPLLPVANPSSSVWYRPSASITSDLNPGAINVIAGSYNDTANDTKALISRASGGSITTMNGTYIPPVQGTSVANVMAQQQQQMAALNMGNQFSETTYGMAPQDTIQVTGFA